MRIDYAKTIGEQIPTPLVSLSNRIKKLTDDYEMSNIAETRTCLNEYINLSDQVPAGNATYKHMADNLASKIFGIAVSADFYEYQDNIDSKEDEMSYIDNISNDIMKHDIDTYLGFLDECECNLASADMQDSELENFDLEEYVKETVDENNEQFNRLAENLHQNQQSRQADMQMG